MLISYFEIFITGSNMNSQSEGALSEYLEETLEQTSYQQSLKVCKYELMQLLGAGGMGEVWKSHHPGLDIPVAVKILKPDLIGKSINFRNRFILEGKLAASINHPNIIRVYDAGNDGDKYFLVMEFIEGINYNQVFKQKSEPLTCDEAVDMLLKICSALEIAHANGIVHRDIKPENIMLTENNEVKLADLGIAKLEEEGHKNTMTGAALGTPYYISPEQARDASSVDTRSDIYSLGATAYHLLTGKHPFSADSAVNLLLKHIHEPLVKPSKRNKAIPEELSDIICRMMEKDREKRYQTISEVKQDLERFKNNISSRKSSKSALPKKSIITVSLIALALVLSVFSLTYFFKKDKTKTPQLSLIKSENKGSQKEIELSPTVEEVIPETEGLALFSGEGVKKDTFENAEWSLSEKNDFIHVKRNSELAPFLHIMPGPFSIKIRLSISNLDHSACSFHFDEQVFGFSGRDNQFFTHGGQFGQLKHFGRNLDYISPGKTFDFAVHYKNGEISFYINQKKVYSAPFLFTKIKRIALVTNRSNVDVYNFSVPVSSSWKHGFFTNRTFEKQGGGAEKLTLLDSGKAVFEGSNSDTPFYNAHWRFSEDYILVDRYYRSKKEEVMKLKIEQDTDIFTCTLRDKTGLKFKITDPKYEPHELNDARPLFYYEDDFSQNFEGDVKDFEFKGRNRLLVDTLIMKGADKRFYTKDFFVDFDLSFSYMVDLDDQWIATLRFEDNDKRMFIRLNDTDRPGGAVNPQVKKAEHSKEKWNNMRIILKGQDLQVFLNGSMVNKIKIQQKRFPGKIGFIAPAKGELHLKRISVKEYGKTPDISGNYFTKIDEYKFLEISKSLKLTVRNEKQNTDFSKYGTGVIELISEISKGNKKYVFKDRKNKNHTLEVVGPELLLLDSKHYLQKID